MATKDIQALGWKDTALLGLLSLWVAFMSSEFVIRAIHTGTTTANWGDPLTAGDGVDSLIAMIAISSIIYNLLSKVNSEHNLWAALGGACLIISAVGIFTWAIDEGNALPTGKSYLGVGILFFLFAIISFFFAWHDQHRSSTR